MTRARHWLPLLALVAQSACCARLDYQNNADRSADHDGVGIDRQADSRVLTRLLYAVCVWPQETPGLTPGREP